MSIVISPPSALAPLSQGDILEKVPLFSVAEDGTPRPLTDQGGDFLRCLVLSRNCQASRSDSVLVAAIRPYRGDQFKALSGEDYTDKDGKPKRRLFPMDELRRRLDAIRDGRSNPDLFYLGDLEGDLIVRYAACLDSLHTICLPTTKEKREEWIATRRVGTLSQDHRRHLHAAILNAVAPEGFDDYQWWSDADLVIMIAAGRAELAEADHERAVAAMDISTSHAKGKNEAYVEGQARKLTGEKLVKLKAELQKYEAEWQSRRPGVDPIEELGRAAESARKSKGEPPN